MALTLATMTKFLGFTVGLPSFPLFCAYLLFVLAAPLFQRCTKPLGLRTLMLAYNFTCVAMSSVTLLGFVYGMAKSPHMLSKLNSPVLQLFFTLYWCSKILELMDTVFMVLRHRSRQISVLHVYHHGSMLLLSDYARLYSPWSAIAFFLALNSFVHVVLYSYYALTALRPNIPVAWKRHLTEIQIIQFLIDFVVAFWGYKSHGFCVYGIFYGLLMTGLFVNFYYRAYIVKRPSRVEKKHGLGVKGQKLS